MKDSAVYTSTVVVSMPRWVRDALEVRLTLLLAQIDNAIFAAYGDKNFKFIRPAEVEQRMIGEALLALIRARTPEGESLGLGDMTLEQRVQGIMP